jgi:hypothetical protein
VKKLLCSSNHKDFCGVFCGEFFSHFAKDIWEKEILSQNSLFSLENKSPKKGGGGNRQKSPQLLIYDDERFLLAGRISVDGPKLRWCHVFTSWVVEAATGIATRCEQVE